MKNIKLICPKCGDTSIKISNGTDWRNIIEIYCESCATRFFYALRNSKSEKQKTKKIYSIKIGKFGSYFYDEELKKPLSLTKVEDLLNRFDNFVDCFKEGDNWIEYLEEYRKDKVKKQNG